MNIHCVKLLTKNDLTVRLCAPILWLVPFILWTWARLTAKSQLCLLMKLKVRPRAPEVWGCECTYSRLKWHCKQRIKTCSRLQHSNIFLCWSNMSQSSFSKQQMSWLINVMFCSFCVAPLGDPQDSMYSKCTFIKCRWVSVIKKKRRIMWGCQEVSWGLNQSFQPYDVANFAVVLSLL